jgi:hypothetical protein
MANYSDGTVYHGDITVTLSSAGSVIIEGFTTSRPSRKVQQYGAGGEPLKQKFFDDFVTATGTIQYNGTKPARYETFTYDSENWVVTDVGETHSSTDYDKSSASFAKRVN